MMKLMLFLVQLVLAAVLCGGTAGFRGGRILCAELSLTDPASAITKAAADRYPVEVLPSAANRIYAAVTFKGHDGRKLSIHDYGIECFGRVYPCVAIRKGGAAFSGAPDAVFNMDPKVTYTMLFVLDSTLTGQNDVEELTVRARFAEGPLSRQKVKFKNLRQTALTPPGRIPPAGLLTEKK